MIPENSTHWQTQDWQQALSQVITCPKELAARLHLPEEALSEEALKGFPLKVPATLLGRIEPGNLNDPVLKQFLPLAEELNEVPGYSVDPLQEKEVNPIPGLLQKFDNRVLLTLSHHCAVHCRYCFRRNFNYADNTPGKAGWTEAYDYIQQNPALEEVILSGGDPLSLPDHYLAWHLERIAAIKHIRVIRFHTRFPVMIPQRITETLLTVFRESPLPIVLVLHSNHAQEINDEVKKACALLRRTGVTMLNQTVILRGINDNANTQRDLAWALFDAGVMPYYLHCFDPVKGAHHFDVPLEEAKAIYQSLREILPGYLVPQLVKEIPGEKAKVVIS
jgi:EF-P beta-lysylation protein EpmB